jgi:hypothetical protein
VPPKRSTARRNAGRLLVTLLTAGACTPGAEPQEDAPRGCTILQHPAPLPEQLDESSGVVASAEHAGVLWTHNDSGNDPYVYAVYASGQMVGRSRVRGAENRDWEDIGIGPCADGTCLYIGDIGDNNRERREIAVYRVPEPQPGSPTEPAERFPMRYPDGAHDAEAMFFLPTGELFVITKALEGPQHLYRYPGPLRAGERVVLEPVVDLGGTGGDPFQQVTGAAVTRSGTWVAVRRYKRLSVFRAEELVAGRVSSVLEVDLTPLGEVQGEAVELLDNGRVVLTSEGGFQAAPGTISVLQCELPD